MQVLISFTLNVKNMTPKELQAYLNLNCPMTVEDNQHFSVSTESWDIISEV